MDRLRRLEWLTRLDELNRHARQYPLQPLHAILHPRFFGNFMAQQDKGLMAPFSGCILRILNTFPPRILPPRGLAHHRVQAFLLVSQVRMLREAGRPGSRLCSHPPRCHQRSSISGGNSSGTNIAATVYSSRVLMNAATYPRVAYHPQHFYFRSRNTAP